MKSLIWEDTFFFFHGSGWLGTSEFGNWDPDLDITQNLGCGDLPAKWACVVRMGHLRTHLAAKKRQTDFHLFWCFSYHKLSIWSFISLVKQGLRWFEITRRIPSTSKTGCGRVLRPQLANASEHCIEKLSNSNWLVTRSTRIWEKIRS